MSLSYNASLVRISYVESKAKSAAEVFLWIFPLPEENRMPSSNVEPTSLDKEAWDAMKELGFSEEECLIYFDLLIRAEGEAIENILAHSKGPAGQAEEAVKSLVDKGMVRIRSNRLEASEPKLALSKLQEDRRAQTGREKEGSKTRASRLRGHLEAQNMESALCGKH